MADAARRVVECGQGALLAKLDLKSAYRMVPVHPDDSPLLGITWKGSTYIDKALPFGLRSAPIIFSAVADGLAWALFTEGVEYSIHYLDDFLFCSPAASSACQDALRKAIPLCERLGLPVAPEKIEGPSTRLTFLGITIDSQSMTLSLPEAKVVQLQKRLLDWTSRRSASKHQLQELLGHLNHAAAVVRPGRAFLRATIETMKRPRSRHQYTRLDTQTKAELTWWRLFVYSWNGVSILPPLAPTRTIISDASGSWGCGAFQQQSGEWLQLPWPETWARMNIAVKELLPIVLAATVWGHNWAGHLILFLSDNMAVVAALNSRAARHPALSHLLKCLFFVQAFHNFEYSSLARTTQQQMHSPATILSYSFLLFHRLLHYHHWFHPRQSRCSPIPPYTGHLLAGRSCSEPLSTGACNIIQSYILLRKEQVLEVLLISQFATTAPNAGYALPVYCLPYSAGPSYILNLAVPLGIATPGGRIGN